MESRKLFIFQGEIASLSDLIIDHHGDWLFITPHADLHQHYPANFIKLIEKSHCLTSKAKLLLGKSYRHAIFDGTTSFNLDALSILAGTLTKESLLILLLPNKCWLDGDSLRWNEGNSPIHTPNFIAHLLDTIQKLNIPLLDLTQKNNLCKDNFIPKKPNGDLNLDEQQTTLQRLLQSDKNILALIAGRGRGKSALAGRFTHQRNAIVTAPNRSALVTFYQFASPTTPFYAPDELLLTTLQTEPEFIIIDEAAMLPLQLLEKILQLSQKLHCRILLTTTIDGYEGTGQGLLLKLLKNRDVDYLYLDQPLRWDRDDIIEKFIDHLSLNVKNEPITLKNRSKESRQIADKEFTFVNRSSLTNLISIYQLLKSAHYRTTLTDLRRLFDAPNLLIAEAKGENQLFGAMIALLEGGLDDELIDQVWQGVRRPKGNLVAQSLVAHAGEKLAAKLRSIRVNRIAVDHLFRRQHIAKQLINFIENYAVTEQIDFISVSFAYDPAVYAFWEACGFTLVHVSSHKESSSGNYSIMVIKALSQRGNLLRDNLQYKLQRNWYWLSKLIDLDLPIVASLDQYFLLQDYEEVKGFANYYRPFEASYPALCRLIIMSKINVFESGKTDYPILSTLLEPQKWQFKQATVGKKTVLKRLKQEVVKLLDDYQIADIL
ncbi:GNAT family N-acetyltransferase [Orbaceae bacterium ESL0721]|nr:GNAT family N-acetyltransferase [Orbaceae bacterium ESL0721]